MFCLFLSQFFSILIQHFTIKDINSVRALNSTEWSEYSLFTSNTLQSNQIEIASRIKLEPLPAGRNTKLVLTPLWNDVFEVPFRSQQPELNVMAINSSICMVYPHSIVVGRVRPLALLPSLSFLTGFSDQIRPYSDARVGRWNATFFRAITILHLWLVGDGVSLFSYHS
jgi:hypothetical protein